MIKSRAKLSAEELFTQYYESIYGTQPGGELVTAFLELLGEGA